MRKNLKAYNQVNIESNLLSADPHQVILMMYDGLLESIAKTKGAIERNDLDTKSKMITKSVNIISALDNSLDPVAEPKISETFSSLYHYCIEKLNDANVTLEIAPIDEVFTLIKPIRDAWKEMSASDKQEGLDLLSAKHSKAESVVGA